MFERIVLRRSTQRRPTTAGELAEALLFYDQVHIVFDYTSLGGLAKSIGTSTLLEVLSRPTVSAVYCDGILATMTDIVGSVEVHELISLHPTVRQKERKTIKSKTEKFQFLLEHHGGCNHSDAKRYAELLRGRIPFRSYSNDDFVPGGVLEAARKDILDDAYVYEAVRRSLGVLSPLSTPLPMFRFKVFKVDGGFIVDTDLDFSRLNGMLQSGGLDGPKVSPAVLLDIIFSARAAHYGSEFVTWSLLSDIVRLRYASLLQNVGQDDVATFQEVVFTEGRTIREAIDSREREFSDFLHVLDKSTKFKTWLRKSDHDKRIIAEYLKAVTAEKWINSLESKLLRYLVNLGGSVIDPALIGFPLSVFDQFLLERLVRGWRPNHFVDDELKPFVGRH